MKEIGMIFKDWGVKATLDGSKTMTRRGKGLEKINEKPGRYETYLESGNTGFWFFVDKSYPSSFIKIKCPYAVGDLIWVKERALYWVSPILEGIQYDKPSDWWTDIVYADDSEIKDLLKDKQAINNSNLDRKVTGNWEWKSPMFMPKWAARLWLEIAKIYPPQRLQDITEEDAEKEGLKYHIDEFQPGCSYIVTCKEKFEQKWNLGNPRHPWEKNPYVWPIEYKERR